MDGRSPSKNTLFLGHCGGEAIAVAEKGNLAAALGTIWVWGGWVPQTIRRVSPIINTSVIYGLWS